MDAEANDLAAANALWDLSGKELQSLSVIRGGQSSGLDMVASDRFQTAPRECLHLIVDRLQTHEQQMMAAVYLMMAFEAKPRTHGQEYKNP